MTKEEIEKVVQGIRIALLGAEAITIHCKRGMRRSVGSAGWYEYEPTSGMEINIVINGGAKELED